MSGRHDALKHHMRGKIMTATNSTTVPATAIRAMNALATLNTLRAAAGKPPLKAWKASKAELNKAITKAQGDAPITPKTPDVSPADLIKKIDDTSKSVKLDPENNMVRVPQADRQQAWKDAPPRRSTIELKSVAISKQPTKEQEEIMAANKSQGKKKSKGGERARFDWEAAEAKAATGVLPTPPDMTAPTHKHYLPKLNEIATLARTGKLKELQSYKVSDRDDGSPGLVKRYQKIAIVALKAKA